MAEIEYIVGDLLDQRVEVMVNPWNRNFIPWWLLLPQGVSGAIKRRAGYQPFRELSGAGILKPGEARLTGAGRLPFRGIIHVAALNAFWRSSPQIIEACVMSALRLASSHHFTSLAFPLLGAGTGGVSPVLAEKTIADTIGHAAFEGRVRIVAFGNASNSALPSGSRQSRSDSSGTDSTRREYEQPSRQPTSTGPRSS